MRLSVTSLWHLHLAASFESVNIFNSIMPEQHERYIVGPLALENSQQPLAANIDDLVLWVREKDESRTYTKSIKKKTDK